MTPNPAEPPVPRTRRVRSAALIVVALGLGLAARSLVADGADSVLLRWLPWLQDKPVTLHFTDDAAVALVPVSRTLDHDATVADLMSALLAGPDDATGLHTLIPAGTTLVAATGSAGRIDIVLGGDPEEFADPLVRAGLRHTLAAWDPEASLALTVSGTPVDLAGADAHLVYFYDEARDMLIAHPTAAAEPRQVLTEFLAGPQTSGLVGLPADVELLEFDYSADSGLLTMDFTYLPSVRRFALDHPDAMRRVLEGLIATMTTGFPQIDGLYLDFEGQATLGLGQCADLLRTLQLHPEVLNDERLLARRAA